jgi:DNA-binding CsgD family transcriptional regulator
VLHGPVQFVRAFIAAHRGQPRAARAAAERCLQIADATGHERWVPRCCAVLGFLELSLGDAAAANVEFTRATELAAAVDYREPCVIRFHHDHVEALVALGELGRAEELIEFLEQRAQALKRPWGLAVSARCRGLVEGARGDLSAAQEALERALEAHDPLAEPFERGRTLLAYGQALRRAKQKRAARETLGDALVLFEQLGAAPWTERARSELQRIGGRRPTTGDELTPSEQRIAELVAQGLQNREVAAALFVTPKTVEFHLRNVFRKLGVRSRAELARRAP